MADNDLFDAADELTDALDVEDDVVAVDYEGTLINEVDVDLAVEGEIAEAEGPTVEDVFEAGDVGESLEDIEQTLKEKQMSDPQGYAVHVERSDGTKTEPVSLDEALATEVSGGDRIVIQTRLQGA